MDDAAEDDSVDGIDADDAVVDDVVVIGQIAYCPYYRCLVTLDVFKCACWSVVGGYDVVDEWDDFQIVQGVVAVRVECAAFVETGCGSDEGSDEGSD